MSDVYVIEVDDEAVGLVARTEDGKSYRFHAAVPAAFRIDHRVFPTPEAANAAARTELSRRRKEPVLPVGRAA